MKTPDLKFRLALVACAGLLMFTDTRSDIWAGFRQAGERVTQPIIEAAHAPAAWSLKRVAHQMTNDELRDENAYLSLERDKLLASRADVEAIRAENTALRSVLGAAARASFDTKLEMVTEFQFGHPQPFITITGGQKAGMSDGMAVMDALGVVGFVRNAYEVRAKVMLITHPDSALPVTSLKSGLRTIIEGRGPGRLLEVMHLPETADVAPGDVLVTSGLGGEFPGGIPVACITHVEQVPGAPFLKVEAAPIAAMDYLDYVLVIHEKG